MKYQGITIVIVNWNGLKWLPKLFESIEKQIYPNIEVVFVDNASSDKSIKYIQNNYPKTIIVESKENLGFAGGNNLGISKASNDLILFLNNDTWIEKDLVFNLVEQRHALGVDLIAPYEASYTKVKKDNYSTTIDLLGHPVYVYKKPFKNFYLSGVCILFSKEMYFDTGGLNNDFFMYFEEIDWFWRLNLLDKSFTYLENNYVYHAGAGSTGQGLKVNSFKWRNENTLKMLITNYSLRNLMWAIPLYTIQNLVELFAFLIVGKPKISYTYIQGLMHNILHIKTTLDSRNYIQSKRIIKDSDLRNSMYVGPGKLVHLTKYITKSHA